MFVVPVSRRSNPFPQAISRLLEDRLERASAACADTAARSPALDVSDNDAEYVAVLDMPGVAKQDVKVSIDGRRVTVQAEASKASETAQTNAPGATSDSEPSARLIHRERASPSYARSFLLPVDVEQAASQARLEHGVLTLTLPKLRARSAANITVN